MDTPAVRLMQRLGLSDEELCAVLDADPLAVIADDLAHRPEIAILLDLTAEAQERTGEGVLPRWLRTTGPAGRPLDLLMARDFAAFEDALASLQARGWVLRGGPR